MYWINLIIDGKYVDKNEPETGAIVLAKVQHWKTYETRYVVLKKVDEDDCSFRTTDDNSELSYSWNVMKWCEIDDND